ncbi:MAG: DNA repair protein RecN [Bacteroidales bacterium]|nr:DNA repair protein RecN [Bacteroidales bacterium]
MLSSIFIDNYALIDKLEINFHKGLSIITGETGAGKSILIGALGLLLGKRADTSILKDKNRKCIVEAVFQVNDHNLEDFFLNQDLDYSNEILIRREISDSGKSRAFVNDTPVNLNVLQELALNIIDIHSQHQNLLLNNETYTLQIVDSYAGTISLLEEYKVLYAEYKQLKQDYYNARESYHSDKSDLDFLTHQFNELREANLKENELNELEAEYKLLNHAEEIKSSLAEATTLLENDETGVIKNLKSMKDSLVRISEHLPEAEEIAERMDSVYIELRDIAGEITIQDDRIEFDEERLQMVTDRMDQLYSLLRKHKAESILNLIELRIDLDKKLQKYSTGDFELGRLSKELEEKENLVNTKAEILSEKRRKIFSEFENKVIALLTDLGMKNIRFSIRNEITELTGAGIDRIQFLFSVNKNIPVQSISKIASGGELSRVMLAIKYLISDSFGLPTIIFDEIDSGVSGEIADKVGNLIKQMADNMQVINITHLPQVASKGDHHYLVYKSLVNAKSATFIKLLDKEERLNEIAKMLSGDSVSGAAIENAKVLLNQQ